MRKVRKIAVVISIIIILFIIALFISLQKIITINKQNKILDSELLKSMTYDVVKNDDAKKGIETEFVKFDAFFLRDLDGDGEAEGIRGTCKEVGKEDTLYMELNVLSNGSLKNGKITINSDNFYLQTAIPKDSEVKDNVISDNTKEINLNEIQNGTQKLLIGVVRSGNYTTSSTISDAIKNDISKYSKVNSVTLTGTHIADDGTETTINKTVEFDVDWYGDVRSEFANYVGSSNYKNQRKDSTNITDETNDEINLEFDIVLSETNNKLNIAKAVIEGEIPELNGYSPLNVEIVGKDFDFEYDSDNRNFSATRNAILNEDNIIVKNAFNNSYGNIRYNKFTLKVTYPLDAYKSLETDSIELKIPVKGWYYGYNNTNKEFSNPYESNIAEDTIVVTFRKIEGDVARFDVTVGKHLYNPINRYVVSKEKAINTYNDLSIGDEEDNYTVAWYGFTGSGAENNTSGMIMKESKDNEEKVSDCFIKSDSLEEDMENVVKNTGIYFSDPKGILGEDGWIIVYNDNTDEILHKFTIDDWGKYSSSNPYNYDNPVEHIRIETSKVNENSELSVYNIKQIDDKYLVDNFDREYFDTFSYIKSTLSGYLGETYINTDINQAVYEYSKSYAYLNINKNTYSTQLTENNVQLTICADYNEFNNESKWTNGIYLIEFPAQILDVEINDISISNKDVEILGYEKIKENDNILIKIYTQNIEPDSYSIILNTNITPDPRIESSNKNINLFAYNEICKNYFYSAKDIYDIDSNTNLEEMVGNNSVNISLISPNSLITSQTASEYDDKGSTTIAPQIALVDKNQNNVTVDLSIANNYANTISDIIILGKVPSTGNKYVINGNDLGSNFDTVLKKSGILVPEELKEYVTIYYSEEINPTKDLSDLNNKWTTNIEECDKIKSFLIDLGSYVMQKGKSFDFKYNLELPDGLNYNDKSYSHHAVYFSLNTEQGKYRTYTEPNKLGVRIAKQYNLDIKKYQKDTDKTIEGVTYILFEEGMAEGLVRTTDANGILQFKNIFAESNYILKEIKSPNQYELNEEEIKFTTNVDENGTLIPILVDGNLRKNNNIKSVKDENGDYKLEFEVEDKVRPNLIINKIEKDTNVKVPAVKFRITGKGLPNYGKILTTNVDGQVRYEGLYLDEEYTIEEIKAVGYYLHSNIKFKIEDEEGNYSIRIIEGDIKNISVENSNDIPFITLDIENEKIPNFNLDILKIETDDNTKTGLPNAKYSLKSLDSGKESYYITDEEGKIHIDNLNQFVEDKELTGEYELKEILAPEGYTTSKDIIRFRVVQKDENLKIEILNEDEVFSIREKIITDNNIQIILEDNPLFTLIKKDSITGEPLSHAKFVIYKVDKANNVMDFAKDSFGNYVGVFEDDYYLVESDMNGIIKLGLPGGHYKVIEMIAPDGYKKPSKNEQYFSIDGAVDEPIFEINSIEDLVVFSNSVNAGYNYENEVVILNRSLDFNDDNSYIDPLSKRFGDINKDGIIKNLKEELTDTNKKGFQAIGGDNSFCGTFDGNSNRIDNLYSRSSNSYQGFFGKIANAMIKDLTISGVINHQISGYTTYYVGGIAGYGNDSTFINCVNECNVRAYSGNSYTYYVGGIVGDGNGNIENCQNKGIIRGDILSNSSLYIGGIGGRLSGLVKNVSNTGTIESSSTQNIYIGGIVGSIGDRSYCRLMNFYCNSDIIGNAKSKLSMGGIVGKSYEYMQCDIDTGYFTGSFEYSGSTKKYGYIIGEINKSTISNCFYCSNSLTGTTNSYGVRKQENEIKSDEFLTEINRDNNEVFAKDNLNINDGYPVFSNNNDEITSINNIEDLVKLSDQVNSGLYNYRNRTIVLNRDLDFNEDSSYSNPEDISFGDINGNGEVEGIKTELTNVEGKGFPIIGNTKSTPYMGSFDGNNKELKNIFINSENLYTGLFGYVDSPSSVINNLKIEGKIISKYNSSSENESYVGGIVGLLYTGSIVNCDSNLNIISYNNQKYRSYIGGIVGSESTGGKASINQCINNGKIENYSSKTTYIGGIIGQSYKQIKECTNNGSIENHSTDIAYEGGIVGTAEALIENCINNGNIDNDSEKSAYIGGITAFSKSNIKDCYNIGELKNSSQSSSTMGGIIGWCVCPKISICYNKGTLINDNGTVGGIAGYAYGNYYIEKTLTEIISCYNVGNIKGKIIDPIITGGNYTNTNVYYLEDAELDSDNVSFNGLGVSSSEMKENSFVDVLNSNLLSWSYDKNIQNEGYPIIGYIFDSDEKITHINFIEDLVKLSKQVYSGYEYEGCTIKLSKTLDFNNNASYKNYEDKSFGDLNSDGLIEGIKDELTNKDKSGFNPIGGTFRGNFDGMQNEIQNIFISSNKSNVGLFANSSGNISNLGISGEIKCNSNNNSIGGIAGYSSGIIDNCTSDVVIDNTRNSARLNIGGIVGVSNNSINNCSFNGNISVTVKPTVNKTVYIGGIAGSSNRISDCGNLGNISVNTVEGSRDYITSKDIYVAGIVGSASGEIARSYNLSDISININTSVELASEAGNNINTIVASGICSNTSKRIINCYNIANIYASNTFKSTVNWISSSTRFESNIYTAGICGKSGSAIIYNCYTVGNLTSLSNMTASVGKVTNNTYAGNISASNSNVSKNYYFENNILSAGTILTGNNVISENDSYMKTEDFVNLLNSSATPNTTWTYTENEYPTLNSITQASSSSEGKNTTKLEITNDLVEYKITTDIKEIDNIKGGSISGEDESAYETVKHGYSSTKEIKMIPDENYEIIGITVNGEEYDFEQLEDGSYIMPQFTDVQEDKHVVVQYCLKENKLVINKVDDETGEKLTGAKFIIKQTQDDINISDIKGELQDNGFKYGNPNVEQGELDNVIGGWIQNDTYFFENNNGSYVSNNTQKSNSTAMAYIPIDLREMTGEYVLVVNASVSSEAGYDYGYATIEESISNPNIDTCFNQFIKISGIQENKDYNSNVLEGGKLYYLYFGYAKDKYTNGYDDIFTINSIKVYTNSNSQSYNFIYKNGKYEPTNQNIENTTSNSYIPIDLSNYAGNYKITVNAEINSANGNYGYVTITDNTNRPAYNSTSGRFVYLTGKKDANEYTTVVEGGKIYYLHLGYYVSDSHILKNEEFIINKIEIDPDGLFSREIENNKNGQAITQIPYGKYKITELKAPDGYKLSEEPLEIDFTENGIHEFTIENTKKPRIIVHHYLKDTTISVADDEEIEGVTGDLYKTYPHLNLEKYILEKDENGEYIIPENATGKFNDGTIEVTYYYIEKEFSLTVHHYIEGTSINVPLEDGSLAEDEHKNGQKGEEYSTSPVENLSKKYTVVEIPENATGKFDEGEIVITYYYKLKEFEITTEVKKHEEKDIFENVIEVEGGDILGKNEKPYEKVLVENDSIKDISMNSDKDYVIEELTVQSIFEDGSITEEKVEEAIGKTNYELDKFIKMDSNKNVIVQFGKLEGIVRVHHYLVGTGEEYGNEPVRVLDVEDNIVEDEQKIGRLDEPYATKPYNNIKSIYKNVSYSDNISGTYTEDIIDVYYYYDYNDYKYTVNYYYDNEKDNSLTEEHNAKYHELVTDYTDNRKEDSWFEKVEPNGEDQKANLIISEIEENNVINVYYRTIYKITTDVIEHEELYKDGSSENVKGGTITGYDAELVETVLKYDDSKNDIAIVPDEGYMISKVTIKNGKDSETIENIDISEIVPGENLILKPEDGYFKNLQSDKHIEVEFKKISNVIVKYLSLNEKDEEGNNLVLAEDEEIKGYENKEFKTGRKNIQYYKASEKGITDEEGNNIDEYNNIELVYESESSLPYAKGTMYADTLTIVYWYERIPSGIIVKHIEIDEDDIEKGLDLDSGKELENETVEGYESLSKITKRKEYEHYIPVDGPESINDNIVIVSKEDNEKEVAFKNEIIEVRFYYEKQYKVTTEVRAHEENGKKVAGGKITGEDDEIFEIVNSKAKNQKEIVIEPEDSYKIKAVEINGEVIDITKFEKYNQNIVILPKEFLGKIEKDIKVVVEFEKIPAKVIVKYLEIDTEKELADEEIIEAKVEDEYRTYRKLISGYELVKEPSNSQGKLVDGENVVIYYYKKVEEPTKEDDKSGTNKDQDTIEESTKEDNNSKIDKDQDTIEETKVVEKSPTIIRTIKSIKTGDSIIRYVATLVSFVIVAIIAIVKKDNK